MFQAIGALDGVPTVLVGLLALAVIVLIGRLLLHVAWKLVLVALVVAAALWLLGTLGFQFGLIG